MTEKLYLHSIESGYFQNFNATVTGVEDAQVILDQTLFYRLEVVKTGILVHSEDRMVISKSLKCVAGMTCSIL